MNPVPRPSLSPLVVSIVSHGHGQQVQTLLEQMAVLCADSVARVVLVQNLLEGLPVEPSTGWPFVLQVVTNTAPLGFGANHNAALADASEPYLCVLNPDVQLGASDPFAALLDACSGSDAGCAYPIQVDQFGHIQSSERQIPSPGALVRRRLLGRSETRVDWVNGACLLMPTPVWRAVAGFDERYFMYCEDVDLCLRIRLLGYRLVQAPVSIIHAGERASSRDLRHLAWHVRSLLRLWSSPVYARAQQLLTPPSNGKGRIGAP